MGTLRQFCYCEHNEDSNGGGGIFGVVWEPPLEEAYPIDGCTAFTTEK